MKLQLDLYISNVSMCCLWALISIGLCHCSTPTHKEAVESLLLGIDKSEVVEKLGSPNRVERHEGVDRWMYTYKHTEKVLEVHFKDAKVIYRGPPKEDAVDQSLQDADNYKEYKRAIEKKHPKKGNFQDL